MKMAAATAENIGFQLLTYKRRRKHIRKSKNPRKTRIDQKI